MSREDVQRLEDILASIDAIRDHARRGTIDDGLVFDAVRARLIEIGEAAKALPPALLRREPGIPWRQVAAMRDRLTHRYFDTSHAIVAATLADDLPEIEDAARRLLTVASHGESDPQPQA
ncbi:MAG: HepT-like ribonuclease domain-containing protein [Acidimicrobiales bacterium]